MKRAVVLLGVAALLPLVAGATHARAGSACRASAVHYRTIPSPAGVSGVPWIATTNAAFRGYLFYWGGTPWARTRTGSLRIFTTKAHVRVSPKVLWVARGRPAAVLSIHGVRLDGRGSFSATYPAASGRGQFPSYVSVPAAGCWRVTVRSGTLRGSVTVAAVDRR